MLRLRSLGFEDVSDVRIVVSRLEGGVAFRSHTVQSFRLSLI